MKPYFRPRRLRENSTLRRMVRETRLGSDQLIYPLFVQEGRKIRDEIPSMPGQFRFSPDTLLKELETVVELSIPAVILFGIPKPDEKDAVGSAAHAADGIICRTLETAKKTFS